MSAELSLNALLGARPGFGSGRAPAASQPPAARAPPLAGEGLLGGLPRQSSAPDTPNLSARAPAGSSQATLAAGAAARVPEPATTKPPSGLSGSVGQQQQAAALQMQLLQQLQMRRAAQYSARGGKSLCKHCLW